jgi:hypothetical protein
MDETPSPKTPDQGLNKLDLSQLQGFSFGTSWSQDKGSPGGARPERREDRPRREGDGPAPRRDRRDFRRPAGGGAAPAGGEGAAPRGDAPPAREGRSFDRRDDRGGPRGGERPRFEGGPRGERGPRREGGFQGGGPRGDFRGGSREPVGPYVSPFFTTTFYPEDNSFKVLADAIRKSCRTFELFYIAKSVVEKNDRFVAVVQRIAPGAKPGHAAPGGEGAEAHAATPPVKPAPFFISVPDGLPFETEDAAISHVLEKHLGQFFDTAEVEVDPPKGNFQVVNRCTITGTLLAPPNYHRYNQIVAQHHAAHIRMPLEAYKAKIETVRDPEVVAQWLEKMKKTTRYTWKPAPAKGSAKAAAPSPAAEAAAATVEGEAPAAPAAETPAVENPAAEAPAAAAPEAEPAGPSFDTIEEARQHLLTNARERVVRSVEQLRFPGRLLESLPATSEIRRAVEGALAAQRRFPLDTANALRGRLRREHFTIFKKGSKGISYVCAVKRRFRVPGQSFSESLSSLIAFIEGNPMVKESELPQRLLGLAPRPAPAEGQAPEPVPAEEQEKLTRLKGDLRYLVKEGYVTEFVDGSLFCPPPMVEARKREIEASEVDPENFPEAPKPAAEPEAAAPAANEPEAPAEPVAEPEPAVEPTAEERKPEAS